MAIERPGPAADGGYYTMRVSIFLLRACIRVRVVHTSACGAYECVWCIRVRVVHTSACGAYLHDVEVA